MKWVLGKALKTGLADALFTDALFADALFADALFADALFADALFTGALFTGALFTGALFTDVLSRAATLGSATRAVMAIIASFARVDMEGAPGDSSCNS